MTVDVDEHGRPSRDLAANDVERSYLAARLSEAERQR